MVYLYMPEKPQVTAARRDPAAAATKMWLWIGVSSISAIILVLWGWATSISLSSFSWNKTPEKKLVDKSRDNWNVLFNDEASRIKNEQIKLQIKNVLNVLAAQTNSTSTSSTANISASNTSTINTSSQ